MKDYIESKLKKSRKYSIVGHGGDEKKKRARARQNELQDEIDTDGYFTARPELSKDRRNRLLKQNILNDLKPSEGGSLDGKDWIQELHETNI